MVTLSKKAVFEIYERRQNQADNGLKKHLLTELHGLPGNPSYIDIVDFILSLKCLNMLVGSVKEHNERKQHK